MRNFWFTRILILILLLVAAALAYNYFYQPFAPQEPTAVVEQELLLPTPTPTIAKKELQDRDKVAQLLAVAVNAHDIAADATESAAMMRFIKDYQPGVVIYYGKQIDRETLEEATKNIYAQFAQTDYQPLLAVDHEGGIVQRLSGAGFTKLESWQTVVTTYAPAQQKAVLSQSAKELHEAGINMVLGPVVDIASSSAFLGNRAAADVDQVALATSNFIYSFAQYGIMPVIKHFPGIGSISRDPHFAVSTITPSKNDTAVFSRTLDTFSNIGVMTAHVRIQDKFNDEVCTLSIDCVGKLGELYPQVLLVTDDLAMPPARMQPHTTAQTKPLPEVAVQAVEAGNHVLMFGLDVTTKELEAIVYTLQESYRDSVQFRGKVDAALARILELKK